MRTINSILIIILGLLQVQVSTLHVSDGFSIYTLLALSGLFMVLVGTYLFIDLVDDYYTK